MRSSPEPPSSRANSARTLPDGADARYLLGIVRNVSAKTEFELFAEALYRNRVEARDHFLAPLRAEWDALRDQPDAHRVVTTCIERAVTTTSNLERTFWLDAVVDTLRAQPDADRERLFQHAARLVGATFSLPPRERQDAVRYVADRLVRLA